MLLNYIITAWRSLLKNRIVSIINIGGLTIGLASAVLAILYANHELSYEEMHKKADNVYRVYLKGDFDQLKWVPTSFGPDGPALMGLFPEIEKYTRIYNYVNTPVRVKENIFYEDQVYAADSNIFHILTFSFIEGSPSNELNTVVISDRVALRYFGKKNPIGLTMNINLQGQKSDFIVTGVFKEFDSNTHIKFDIIAPFTVINHHEWIKPDEYQGTSFITFVLLREGTDYNQLNNKINLTYKMPVEINNIGVFLMPLKEVHMKGTWGNTKGKLLVFLFGGFFVLIITSLNYINLTNILFSTRNKEIGIRKVVGARQKHIIFQFLTDTILSTLIAFNLAIIIIKLILPWFNSLMDTNITISSNTNTLFLLLLILIGTICISGFYPSLRYSFIKPVSLMKPSENPLGSKGYSRRFLTTFQFFLAIIFIQAMLAMNKQGIFMSSEEFKLYDSEDVICIAGNQWGDLFKVKEQLLKNPAIESVTWGSVVPEMGVSLSSNWKDKDNKTLASIYNFEEDYINVFKIKMIDGRFFSKNFPSDNENAIVINKLAAKILEYDDPVGKTVLVGSKIHTIIGVIDTYRAVPPIFDHVPLLIGTGESYSDFLSIRIDPSKREIAKEHITKILRSINPEIPIELKYHNDLIYNSTEAKSYVSAGQLINLFFILTIITSLIGLFGLSLFIAERNKRVVSIRKVFGASIPSIMLRLSKGIITQILIAIILATPVSMIVVTGYLSVFPTRVQIGLPFYLMGGGLALLMVLITVSWQTWRAANTNPADALRCE